eukprot:Amastigsp_a704529_3.p2 type:complete len:185 gc:universal Amastigsp_a704529_3:271-825(+)
MRACTHGCAGCVHVARTYCGAPQHQHLALDGDLEPWLRAPRLGSERVGAAQRVRRVRVWDAGVRLQSACRCGCGRSLVRHLGKPSRRRLRSHLGDLAVVNATRRVCPGAAPRAGGRRQGVARGHGRGASCGQQRRARGLVCARRHNIFTHQLASSRPRGLCRAPQLGLPGDSCRARAAEPRGGH